jgi:hypothetical protein
MMSCWFVEDSYTLLEQEQNVTDVVRDRWAVCLGCQ